MLALWNGIAFWSAPNVNTPLPATTTAYTTPPSLCQSPPSLSPAFSSFSAWYFSSRPGRPPKRTQSVTSPENPHIMPHSVPGLMSPGMIPPTGTAWS
ncbi:dachshund homolog 1 isoform X1 [Lates japonicus]|uniref:Dachshund homolog 1 isoform X1 n=1 Tax=Lates japonicus TaxID=270547 RepID=A0AAD3NHB4_LATJO|nr:dachshund homolog 1 isoform X1 [Lates japonicus]